MCRAGPVAAPGHTRHINTPSSAAAIPTAFAQMGPPLSEPPETALYERLPLWKSDAGTAIAIAWNVIFEPPVATAMAEVELSICARAMGSTMPPANLRGFLLFDIAAALVAMSRRSLPRTLQVQGLPGFQLAPSLRPKTIWRSSRVVLSTRS